MLHNSLIFNSFPPLARNPISGKLLPASHGDLRVNRGVGGDPGTEDFLVSEQGTMGGGVVENQHQGKALKVARRD